MRAAGGNACCCCCVSEQWPGRQFSSRGDASVDVTAHDHAVGRTQRRQHGTRMLWQANKGLLRSGDLSLVRHSVYTAAALKRKRASRDAQHWTRRPLSAAPDGEGLKAPPPPCRTCCAGYARPSRAVWSWRVLCSLLRALRCLRASSCLFQRARSFRLFIHAVPEVMPCGAFLSSRAFHHSDWRRCPPPQQLYPAPPLPPGCRQSGVAAISPG